MKTDIKKILKKQGVSVSECAKCFNRSRTHFYNIINNCNKGEKPTPNYAVNWAVNYLFGKDLSKTEFAERLRFVQEKLKTMEKSGMEKHITRSLKGKVIPLYRFGENEYVVIDNIQSFKYNQLEDGSFTLTINNVTKPIKYKELIAFLSIFDLKIE